LNLTEYLESKNLNFTQDPERLFLQRLQVERRKNKKCDYLNFEDTESLVFSLSCFFNSGSYLKYCHPIYNQALVKKKFNNLDSGKIGYLDKAEIAKLIV